MTSEVRSNSELHLGIVGFGRLVRDYYLPGLRRIAGVLVVAVADPLLESRRVAKNRLPNAEMFEDHSRMLECCRLDSVLIASPPSTHLEIWTHATRRGIPAFVEKPLVLSSQISDLDVSKDVPRVMIDFNRRFWPTYNRVRDLVREGALGSPVRFEFALHLDVLRWSTITSHRLDPREGGPLHDLGCHAIDLATEVIGEAPISVQAMMSSTRSAEDQVQMQLAFPSGSLAKCDLGYGNRTRERLEVHGPMGRVHLAEPNMALHVEINGRSQNLIISWLRDATALGYRGFRPSESMGLKSISGALAAFIDSVRSGASLSPGFAEGMKNAICVAAAVRSAASRGSLQQL